MASVLAPEKVEYDMDTSGGLMEEIQALIAPPQSEDSKRRLNNVKETVYKRHPGRAVNRDSCDGCGEGGDLLCCDQCPSSFHLNCCDPPLEDEDVPTGEWICRECRFNKSRKVEAKQITSGTGSEKSDKSSSRSSSPVDSELDVNPFQKLANIFRCKNPSEFKLPLHLQDFTAMPGDRKGRLSSELKSKQDDAQRLCFVCTRGKRIGRLLLCDFCPLVFHFDCLSPPLTQEPTGLWMCPNHPEHFEPRLKTAKYSQKVDLIEDLRSSVMQNAIKIEFFRRAKKERIQMNRPKYQPRQRKKCVVPKIVKALYLHPPAAEVPDFVQAMGVPLRPYQRPMVLPNNAEKEQWLKSVVDLHCSIARDLELHRQAAAVVPSVSKPVLSQEGPGAVQLKEAAAESSCGDLDAVAAEIKQQEPEPTENKDSKGSVGLSDASESPVEAAAEIVAAAAVPSASTDSVVAPSTGLSTATVAGIIGATSPCSLPVASPAKIIILATQSNSSSCCSAAGGQATKLPALSTGGSKVLLPAVSTVGGASPRSATSKASVGVATGNHMVSSISTEILKDPTLSQLDDRLIRILAFQRLQQLVEKKGQHTPRIIKPGVSEKKTFLQVTETKKAIAVLAPLNGQGSNCFMRHRSLNAGQGADMDLCLTNFGFCNYVSSKHATIFFDEETRQFELLNYSEHGTIVDNVLYSCDFSEKPRQHVMSSSARPLSALPEPPRKGKPPVGRTTCGLGTEFVTRSCGCRASASSLIGGSGAGWEGTAVLHHGSYVKFGCLHFVFSIVECAPSQLDAKVEC